MLFCRQCSGFKLLHAVIPYHIYHIISHNILCDQEQDPKRINSLLTYYVTRKLRELLNRQKHTKKTGPEASGDRSLLAAVLCVRHMALLAA